MASSPKEFGTHGEHQQPTARMYVAIGVVLFGITLLELLASFMVNIGLPDIAQTITLLVLAAVKGSLVVLFFMHLRFDSRWFSFLFTTGIILAVFAIISFLVLFTYKANVVA